jgi:hypothetical protein
MDLSFSGSCLAIFLFSSFFEFRAGSLLRHAGTNRGARMLALALRFQCALF